MRTSKTSGFRHFRRPFAAVGTVACVTALGVAPAALGSGATAAVVKESRSKTITIDGDQTETINVVYPNALKREIIARECSWKIDAVNPGKVRILFHGTVLGGTVCRVKARNTSEPSVKIKVTATTSLPASRHRR
jgi:type 1 fimbria pilin